MGGKNFVLITLIISINLIRGHLLIKITCLKQTLKIVKDTNSLTAGIWIPAISQEALESYCKNFAIDIPRNPDKSINWDEFYSRRINIKKIT